MGGGSVQLWAPTPAGQEAGGFAEGVAFFSFFLEGGGGGYLISPPLSVQFNDT